MNYNVNNENERIIIGEVGENLAESCTIDYSAWVEEYGEGNLRIRAIREGDAEPYPVANVETADGVATWTYTAADTAVKGFGEVQVLYYVGDVLAKSRVWKTYTYRSLNTSSEEVPDPYADWLNAVERIGGQVESDAEAASASADSASASATLAAGSASEAAESALSASRSASAAMGSASAASTSAESAESSASAASRSATEASNYEYYSEQYMNEAKSAKFGAESARTGAENAKAAAQASATAAAQSAESIEASADLIQKLLANQIKDTATGTIATYPDGADMPMVSLVADIEPIQDTSGGAPSPSNICPISGWDEVETVVSGKNLCDNSVFGTYGLVEQSDGSWYADNNNKIYDKVVWQNDRGIEGQLAIVFKYRYSNADYIGAYPTVYYTDGTRQNLAGTKTTVPTEISTVTKSGKIVDRIVMVYSSNGAQSYVNLMVTEDLTATTYEPYQGHTHTTTLPQTVYGGTLDVVSGVLTVDRAMVDLGTLNWGTPNENGRTSASANAKPIASSTELSQVIGEEYGTITARQWYDTDRIGITLCGAGYGTDGNIGIFDSRFIGMTSAEVKSLLSGSKAVYELATPQTYQLTTTQIDSLLGRNSVWADSGDVTVEYIADTKLYIQKVIS